MGLLFLMYLVYYIYLKSKVNKISWNKKLDVEKKVSLIVATYNEEATLPDKIKNIMELDYPKKNLEVVFIDSGSTDKTVEIIQKFRDETPEVDILFLRESERHGKSHALNVAYPAASGEIKIISDADAILDKSALTQVVSNFSDPSVGAACGKQILLNPNQNTSTLLEKQYRTFYETLREGESILDSTPIFHGELSAYRANLIDVLPENKSADDSRLANNIRKKGFRSVYDSSARFYEYAPPSTKSRFTQKVRRGQGLIRLFWDFTDVMFRKKYGLYGLVILPMEFFMHCIFPSLWVISIPIFLFSLFSFSSLIFSLSIVLALFVFFMSYVRSKNRIINTISSISTIGVSFFSSQIILFYGMLLWVSGRSLHKWKKVEAIREEWNVEQ